MAILANIGQIELLGILTGKSFYVDFDQKYFTNVVFDADFKYQKMIVWFSLDNFAPSANLKVVAIGVSLEIFFSKIYLGLSIIFVPEPVI